MLVFLAMFLLPGVVNCGKRCSSPWGSGIYGTYCKHDLSGYFTCSGNVDVEQDVTCPQGTRCACFLYNNCHDVQSDGFHGEYGVKEENICQSLQVAHPMKMVMHLRYTKGGWEMGDPHLDEYHYFDEDGEIKQDLITQRAMYTWGNPNRLHFKLIVPDNDGTFMKYTGQHPNKCREEQIQRFEEFAGEIKYYRLKEKHVLKDGVEKQVWYNQIFRFSDDNGLTKMWTVKSDSVDNHVVPLRYDNTYTGTQEEQCCDHHIIVTYKELHVDDNQNTDDWFQIPDFCPQI